MRLPALLLFLGLLTPSAAAQEDDFWALELRTGQESLLKGRFAEAENTFEEILLSAVEDPPGDRPDATTTRRARQGLMELELLRGGYVEVEKQIEKLAADEKKDVGYRALWARTLERQGKYERAGKLWLGLVETNADDVMARYSYGVVLAETGQREAARQAWTAAVDHFDRTPADALTLAYLGKCMGRAGWPEQHRAREPVLRQFGARRARATRGTNSARQPEVRGLRRGQRLPERRRRPQEGARDQR